MSGAAETEREALARDLVATAVLRGRFTLRSGAVSDYYIDKYRLTTDPALLARITDALLPLLFPDARRIAGTAVGAVPLSTALSLRTGLPALIVRSDAKAHGTAKGVEGVLGAGDQVVLVEDVVTSGGAALAAVDSLTEAGARVLGVVCVVDREQGGAQAFADAEVELRALFTRTQLGLGG